MFKNWPRLFRTILVPLTLGVLAVFLLPNFSLQIGDRAFTWQGLDLTILGLQSNLGNFRLGKDLSNTAELSYVYNAGSEGDVVEDVINSLHSDAELFRARLDAAGLQDIGLRTEVYPESSLLVFEFPGNYSTTDAEILSRLAVTPGTVEFWQHDAAAAAAAAEAGTASEITEGFSPLIQQIFPGYTPKEADFSIADLSGIAVESRSNLVDGSGNFVATNVWRLKFKPEAVGRITAAIAAGGGFRPLIGIDGEPGFVLAQLADSNDFLALPIFANGSSQLRLMSTYLTTPGVPLATYEFNEQVNVPSEYMLAGKRLLLGAMVVGLVITSFWVWRRNIAGKGWESALNIVWGWLLLISLLKLAAVPLNVTVILSLAFLLVLWVFITSDLSAGITQDTSSDKQVFGRWKAILILILLTVWLAANVISLPYPFTEAMWLIGVGVALYLINLYGPTKWLLTR